MPEQITSSRLLAWAGNAGQPPPTELMPIELELNTFAQTGEQRGPASSKDRLHKEK